MILIIKTKEPASWTRHRLTPGADYEATDDLRNALLKDQGYICAYCMRRIPANDNGTDETSRIEHIVPRNILKTASERMDFADMVICCPGAITSTDKKKTHCDRHKDETPIAFSPLNADCIATLSYLSDGTLKSSSKQYDTEINEVLNLNLPLLKANRLAIKTEIINQLNSRPRWRAADIRRLLAKYTERDENGRLTEYCGVAVFYLEKKLRAIEK